MCDAGLAKLLGLQRTQFMERVRARDQHCVISGWSAPFYTGLEACHIIPRNHSGRVSDLLSCYSANDGALVASRSIIFASNALRGPEPVGRMESD